MRLLVVAALAAAALAVVPGCGGKAETSVPEVVPRYVQDAVARLEAAGLTARVEDVPPIVGADGSVNGYAVTAQDPAAGTRVDEGSTVTLRVDVSLNGGPGGLGEPRVVPDLVGMDVNRALGAATSAGLLTTVVSPADEVDALVVRSQSLTPGSRVTRGDEIRVTLG